MNRMFVLMAALASVGLAADVQSEKKPAPPRVTFTGKPLSFEPNVGQGEPGARFVAHGAGYDVQLGSSRAEFQFVNKSHDIRTVSMDLTGARPEAEIRGESLLPGKANYLPTSDPKTWHTNISTYSRVSYEGVYPGVDLAFYGNASRLEYDFLLNAGADPAAIGMRFSGADRASVDASGDLLLRLGKGDIRFLKPIAYQTSTDGKRRDPVQAGYRLERSANGEPVLVSFSIGNYDHARPLVIDPVVTLPSLIYSEYVSSYAAAVAVDSSGNTYVAGQSTNSNGFYVTKLNPSGTVVYNVNVGSGGNVYPYAIAVDSTTGQAYVAGQIYSGDTLPISAHAYQSTVTASYNAFLAVISANGASVPYATYLGGTDSSNSSAQGIAVDSTGDAYLTGLTYSATFPTTSGAYQTAFSPSYEGFVAKFNPAASTGPTSLVYSTLLGPANSNLIGVAVDSSGDAYVTGLEPAGFPVTTGAFRYAGYDSGNGGVYVTKLNSTGTALVYSAYLGYGIGYGIAVEGQSSPSAYVTGIVNYADFPTTAGAYQTDYAGGFVTKLSSDGSTEVYSTFLGGPSSYSGGTSVFPSSIALPNGCSSSCNAYISGWTNTADFPTINAIQTTPSVTGNSAFVAEIAANGASALFSSYLSGYNSGVYNLNSSESFGITPSIGVDSSGNMSVVGNILYTSDFPITISTTNPTYAFLAKIGPTSTPFIVALPSTINFGNQAVGVSTSISNGTATIVLRNMSATTATLQPITASPAGIFTESDNCGGSIPGGGSCTLSVNFTPSAPGARTGSVTVISNASDSPTIITLNGTGVDAAYITASPTSLVFGNQATGTSSAPQGVTLTNIGDETAALNVYTNTANFSELNNCPSQLAPGSSCLVNVTFSPTQPGLLTDNLYFYSPSYGTGSVPLSGSGTVTGATSALTLSTASISFANQVVNTTSPIQQIFLTNNGTVPIAIQSISTSVTTGSGSFGISYDACANPTGQLNPQQTCQLQVNFTPTAAGAVTGKLTINDSATGSPHTVSLSGTGVAATETLEFYPATALVFPDTPVGVTSAQQVVYAQNAGTAAITMDRVLVSGDFHITNTGCQATTLNGTLNDGSGAYSYCYVYVTFTPTTTGARTGSLTFIDSASNSPQTVSLSGNGIAATGSLALSPTQLNFPTEAVGTTSAVQYVQLFNPGDTAITVNSFSATGDFSAAVYNCTPPFSYGAGATYCYVQVTFTPTAAGSRTGTLTVNSSAGNQTASLSGTGVAASLAIGTTPTSMAFGSVVVGNTASQYPLYIRNTGTDPVTLTSIGATGTDAGDFNVNTYTCPIGGTLQPNSNCEVLVSFTPGASGSRTATLQIVDSAGTQNVALGGTGVAAEPSYYTSSAELAYNTQVQGTTSPTNTYVYFYNNSGASVTLGTAAVTTGFVVPTGDDTCSGNTISNGGSCYVYVSFAPTTSGYITGTLTFKNSGGTTLYTVPLAGYSPAAANSAYLDPTALNFTTNSSGQPAVVGTTSSNQTVALYNSGNLPLTVGTVTGTNIGAPPTNEFAIASDGCSSQTVQPGSSCTVYVNFTPSTTGAQTGTLKFPVTYANNTTANLTANLAGTGLAEKNSAVVTPTAASFVDQTVGIQTAYNVAISLTNSGNVAFTVGTLTGTNTIVGASGTGEFSASPANNGSDGCSGQTVQPGSTCNVYVTFTPSAAGPQTGSITFPVTFKDGTTANPTVTLSGNGIAANTGLQINPLSIQFPVQVQSTTSAPQAVYIKNTGNAPIHFGTDTASANFGISYDSCVGVNLNYNATCQINVTFTPTTTGALAGTLTIADNGTGGPHSVALSGTGIPANQQIALSQTTVAFGNQPAGSTSSTQVVYVTNQSDNYVSFSGVTLAGSNPTDFTKTTTCPVGGSLAPRSACTISVTFAPLTGTSGALSATVTVTDSDSGSPRTITLTGTSVTPGPAVALTPSSGLTFTKQNVGTTSPAQNFSVTNTGTANLTITSVVSTNSTEFPISSDGCSGATLTPHQQCTVSVSFSPTLGGTRSGTIKITDNATGSPQSLAVSGLGYGVPEASFNPTSLTFASTNQGTTTSAQTTVLSNPGTDTLDISNIAITGPNAADFTALSTTCGATLAPAASCNISVKFDPTAPGSRTAAITVTDNANNVPGSTQSATLNGTGLGLPTAGVSGPLTFSSTSVGAISASQEATLTNSGGGTLSITSIGFTGTDPGDFTETNNCGTTLAAGASCNVFVSFKPAASGSRTANLTFTDNSGGVANSKQNVALTGTGVTPVAPTVTGVTPNSGTGSTQSFTFTYSDTNPGGYTDMKYLFFLFYSGQLPNSCYGYYVVASNQVILYNNAATGAVPGHITPGTAGTLANSQCSIDGAGTSVQPSGNTIAITLPITFSTTFPGTKTIRGVVYDNENQSSATNLGTWNTGVEQAPTIVSLSPNSGSGLGPQVFAFTYGDANGTGDLGTLYFNFSNGAEGASHACYGYYNTANNQINLYNDAGNGTVPGSTTVGSGGTLSNSQCSISGVGSSVATSGNNLTLSVSITFQTAFATGSKNVYMDAFDKENESTGFINEGTWTP